MYIQYSILHKCVKLHNCMFFSISKQPKINFPVRIQIGEIWINLDEGWHQKNKNLFFKGYADFDNLNKNLQEFIDSLNTKIFSYFLSIILQEPKKQSSQIA